MKTDHPAKGVPARSAPKWGWSLAFWLHVGGMGYAAAKQSGWALVVLGVSLLALVRIESRRVRRVYPAKVVR